jgi:hypothetical protein
MSLFNLWFEASPVGIYYFIVSVVNHLVHYSDETLSSFREPDRYTVYIFDYLGAVSQEKNERGIFWRRKCKLQF